MIAVELLLSGVS